MSQSSTTLDNARQSLDHARLLVAQANCRLRDAKTFAANARTRVEVRFAVAEASLARMASRQTATADDLPRPSGVVYAE